MATASVAPEAAAAAVGSKLYDHKQIEARWQKHWEEKETFKTPERTEGRPKKFVLDMFPYPSGSGLHVGHPEGYTASDVMARCVRADSWKAFVELTRDAEKGSRQ